jgi:hypothetical protein
MNQQDLNVLERVNVIVNSGGLIGLDALQALTVIRCLIRPYYPHRDISRDIVETLVHEVDKKYKLELKIKRGGPR